MYYDDKKKQKNIINKHVMSQSESGSHGKDAIPGNSEICEVNHELAGCSHQKLVNFLSALRLKSSSHFFFFS